MFVIAGHKNMVGANSSLSRSERGRGGGRKTVRRGRGGTTKPLNAVIREVERREQEVEMREQEERGGGSIVGGTSRGTEGSRPRGTEGSRPQQRKRRGGGRGPEEAERARGRGNVRVEETEREASDEDYLPPADGSEEWEEEEEEEGREVTSDERVYLRGMVALPKDFPRDLRMLVTPKGHM